ncbi:MAG: DUF1887 family CARF protein [Candidatus Syntrophosphaera sp.]
MPRHLVSLLSENSIPNLLLIKTLSGIDRYLFIRPRRLNGGDILKRLCEICEISSPTVLEVDEYNLEAMDEVLGKFLAGRDPRDEFVVNLTGGTRIMALAVFDAFRKLDSRILYLPPGVNSAKQLWPEHREAEIAITHRLDMDEYLRAFGVEAEIVDPRLHSYEQAEKMFRLVSKNSDRDFMHRVNKLGSKKGSRRDRKQQGKTIHLFSSVLGIDEREVLRPEWLNYIKGIWFEEYVTHWINRVLGDGTARHGVQVLKDGVVNEVDAAFVYENRLFFLELKASAQTSGINDYLYKLDSVGKDFGLQPICHLVIADHDVEQGLRHSGHFKYRAAKMGIGILTYSQLTPENIETSIRKMVRLD